MGMWHGPSTAFRHRKCWIRFSNSPGAPVMFKRYMTRDRAGKKNTLYLRKASRKQATYHTGPRCIQDTVPGTALEAGTLVSHCLQHWHDLILSTVCTSGPCNFNRTLRFLDGIQRRTTKPVKSLKGVYSEEMRTQCSAVQREGGWGVTSLLAPASWGREVDRKVLISLGFIARTCGNNKKLCQERLRLDIKKHLFSKRVE